MPPSDTPPRRTPHHYVLAHIALRRVALADPYGFFAVMASPRRQAFLEKLWEQVRQNCDWEGAPGFGIDDVDVITTRLGDYPTLLVEMPPARFATEAYMICVVLKVSREALAGQPDNPEIGYFTLERSAAPASGKTNTVFCAWQAENHLNLGAGPEPTPVAFLGCVAERLQAPPATG